MSARGKAFRITAISVAGLSIISAIGAALHPFQTEPGEINLLATPFYILWFLAVVICTGAAAVAVGFAIRRRSDVAYGIFFGVGVGLLALTASCAANFASYPYSD